MKKVLLASILASVGFATSAMAGDLLQSATEDGSFKTFVSAIKTAGVESDFQGKGPITVFAPNDDAFGKIPKDKLKALFADKAALKKMVELHIVDKKVTKADIDAGKVKSVEGEDLSLSVTDGVKIDNANIFGPQVDADNGVIHALTSVLMPKS